MFSREMHDGAGHVMMSCSDDGSLKLWDLREGQLTYSLRAHVGSVCSTSFSASGPRLVNGSVHLAISALTHQHTLAHTPRTTFCIWWRG